MVAKAERPTPLLPNKILLGDFEGQTSVAIYDCSPRRVIREVLELHYEQMWRKDHPDQGMRDSGLWSRKQSKRGLAISVTVGCGCSRDCCGHLCSLSYEITHIDGLTIVVTSMGFNY